MHFVDLNECATDDHDCEHTCVNTEGSYECACDEGYYLWTDERTCKREYQHNIPLW